MHIECKAIEFITNKKTNNYIPDLPLADDAL